MGGKWRKPTAEEEARRRAEDEAELRLKEEARQQMDAAWDKAQEASEALAAAMQLIADLYGMRPELPFTHPFNQGTSKEGRKFYHWLKNTRGRLRDLQGRHPVVWHHAELLRMPEREV